MNRTINGFTRGPAGAGLGSCTVFRVNGLFYLKHRSMQVFLSISQKRHDAKIKLYENIYLSMTQKT